MNDDLRSRSLKESEDSDEPQLDPEFDAPLEPPTSEERRRFLQVSAASIALAGASACRWKEDKLLPYAQRPDGTIPGVPRFFRTAMEIAGAAVGLTVKSFDGRPIKVDGNPHHPDSLGATSPQHQASLLDLYDPDRSTGFARLTAGQARPATEIEFRIFAREQFRGLGERKGQGLAVLAGASSSPSLTDLRTRWLARFPESRWYEYEPAHTGNERRGSRLAFGAPFRTHLRLDRARVIVSLEADILCSRPDALALARAWSEGRKPESGRMNRTYVFESSLSETGSAADHRFSVRSEHIKALAAYLDAELSRRLSPPSALGTPQPAPAAKFLDDPALAKVLRALLGDLEANRGASIVAVGDQQPAEVHALVHRINAVLGNVGSTLEYSRLPEGPDTAPAEQLGALAKEMSEGRVQTLLILDSNPVYTAPADIAFAAALGKVPAKISAGLYLDETTRACDWHVPLAHYLEAWGDVRASDGTISIQQPLIAPLYGGKSKLELLAMLSGDELSEGQAIVKRSLAAHAGDERLWRKSVHDGVVPGTAIGRERPVLSPIAAFTYAPNELSSLEADAADLELVLAPDPRIHDGRFANNGWLQEMPDPITKLTWDNALLINPKTAALLGVTDNERATISVAGRSLDLPAMISPGLATGSVKIHLGYGRTAAGRVGGAEAGPDPVPAVGVNAYALRSTRLWDFGRGAVVKPTGETYRLATTQDKHSMDRIGKFGTQDRLPMLVRQANLSEYQQQPDFAQHAVHHPPLLSLWKEPVKYDGHKWGMSIDLNKCIGCSGCVIACQAENNVPVVGRDRVAMGREMHWLRIDRYYRGDDAQLETLHQPIPCMHCEHAPCEQVCPVGATTHSSEGLNDMTYNRCIGTRYCQNNCPYKVRRFNYFNFHEDLKQEKNQVKSMGFNPEVTVRFRGVMEKCTYCVQRIQDAKIRAGREHRPVGAAEITTACQDACPTRAITFGDLNNPESAVAELKKNPRDYAMLEELNVRPRTTYLARVRNPHPELA